MAAGRYMIVYGGKGMDTDAFQRSIEEADNNSLRIGAANRIVQLLQKLRFSNNETSAKRWVWELCQNAKDSSNDTGRVKIAIDFDEAHRTLMFRHNGKAFSMANAISLINQTSSKDRHDGSKRKSGKFGTGFLTTHLLSQIVHVSGILETQSGSYSRFHFTLDRSGREQKEIVTAMERAVEQLKECTPVQKEPDWSTYQTTFEYRLEEDGIEVAKQGIEVLRLSAPFVLSRLNEIEEIALGATGEIFQHKQSLPNGQGLLSVHKILYKSKTANKDIEILNLTEDGITVSAEVDRSADAIHFVPFTAEQPKLFCDFPLLGTEDFPFPVIISASDFNPTEPRDGIYLTCQSKTKLDDEIEQNRRIIGKACSLYTKLLQYAAHNHWGGIYHVTQIKPYKPKDWYDQVWMKKMIETCQRTILQTAIIHTDNNQMNSLQDPKWDIQVYIISDPNPELRERIWALLHPIMPARIPRREDIHRWYDSLWHDCNPYTFQLLTKQLHAYGTVAQLQSVLTDCSWQDWLVQYYDGVEASPQLQKYITDHQMKIIPDQNGVFHSVSALCFDQDILQAYKEIYNLLAPDCDCQSWLLHTQLKNRAWFQAKETGNSQMLDLIEANLEHTDAETKHMVLLQMLYFYDKQEENLAQQQKLCGYTDAILRPGCSMVEVPMVSKKLQQQALHYAVAFVADWISACGDMERLALDLGKSMEETTGFMADFIEFTVQTGHEALINRSRKPILPNQNGTFMAKDDLFLDAEMDETLKELATHAGSDIKAQLLMKQIYLKLPENREKRDSDVAPFLTQYVITNRTSQDQQVRQTFRVLLQWLRDNPEKAQKIFPDLYQNKHYLYDDEEIHSDLCQAEEFRAFKRRHSVSTTAELDALIEKGMAVTLAEEKKSEITQEILLQYGIDSQETLERAFADQCFAKRFFKPTKHDPNSFAYAKSILERSKNNIFTYLKQKQCDGYDLSNVYPVSETIFVIQRYGKEIYLLARPSDGGEVRIYYPEEQDILDYSKDWELWVEDGVSQPQKLSFGKIIKLAGINRIPLKGMEWNGV